MERHRGFQSFFAHAGIVPREGEGGKTNRTGRDRTMIRNQPPPIAPAATNAINCNGLQIARPVPAAEPRTDRARIAVEASCDVAGRPGAGLKSPKTFRQAGGL